MYQYGIKRLLEFSNKHLFCYVLFVILGQVQLILVTHVRTILTVRLAMAGVEANVIQTACAMILEVM